MSSRAHHAVSPISDHRDFVRKERVSAGIRRVIFAIRSPAGGICRIQGPVSGRKNSVPGAVMPMEGKCLRREPEPGDDADSTGKAAIDCGLHQVWC